MRNFLHTGLFAALIILGSLSPCRSEDTSMTQMILENSQLSIVFDQPQNAARCSISRMTDLSTAFNFIEKKAAKSMPIYRVTLVDKSGKQTVIDSRSGRYQSHSLGKTKMNLTFSHKDISLLVTLSITLPENSSLSYWRLNIENQSEMAIYKVDFPIIPLPQVSSDSPDRTRIVFPTAKRSLLFHDIPYELKWNKKIREEIFEEKLSDTTPQILARRWCPDIIQMMAYYNDKAGLFLGTFDSQAYVKEYIVEASPQKNWVRLRIDHTRSMDYGGSFSMDYDTVVGIFKGDWTAAADIYRNWATKQKWCKKGPVAQRQDIPQWVKDYPFYFRLYLLWPKNDKIKKQILADKLHEFGTAIPLSYCQKLIDQFPVKALLKGAMVHVENYSKLGYWSAYYKGRWPSWMGNARLKSLFESLKKQGFYLAVEPYGFHMKPRGPNGYDLFTLPDINYVWNNIISRRKYFPSKPPKKFGDCGYSIFSCIATNYAQTIYLKDIAKMTPWGLDYLQIMEIYLTGKMDCYNTTHGHPAGMGKWIFPTVYNVFQKAMNLGKNMNPDFVLDKEDTAEYLIPVTDMQLVRNAQTYSVRYSGRPNIEVNNIPLFDYIYHEYIPLIDFFQGYCREDVLYNTGRAIVLGHITGPVNGPNPKNYLHKLALSARAYELMLEGKKVCSSFWKKYLLYGRVIPSPRLTIPRIQVKQKRLQFQKMWKVLWTHNRGTKNQKQIRKKEWAFKADYSLPAVVINTHLSQDGKVGITFVNCSTSTVTLTIPISELNKYRKYINSHDIQVRLRNPLNEEESLRLNKSKQQTLRLEIPARKILLIELTRSTNP